MELAELLEEPKMLLLALEMLSSLASGTVVVQAIVAKEDTNEISYTLVTLNWEQEIACGKMPSFMYFNK